MAGWSFTILIRCLVCAKLSFRYNICSSWWCLTFFFQSMLRFCQKQKQKNINNTLNTISKMCSATWCAPVSNSSNFEFMGCHNILASRWIPMLWRNMMLHLQDSSECDYNVLGYITRFQWKWPIRSMQGEWRKNMVSVNRNSKQRKILWWRQQGPLQCS